MISFEECCKAVYEDSAQWFCPTCESFYTYDSDGIEADHDHSFTRPVCAACDDGLLRASEAYK